MKTPDFSAYPVLDRAYRNPRQINSPWVEMPNGEQNPAQIFRQPFVYKIDRSDLEESSQAAWDLLMADIEKAFVHGEPQEFRSGSPLTWSALGGVRHWLGRDLGPDDEIAVAVLYPLTLKLAVGEHDLFNDHIQHGEWITEVSLWVKGADEKES